MAPDRFDAMLMEILQERKTIGGFLDAVFGFLSRNTDFYFTQENINDKVGFPEGMKEQIVMKFLQKHDPKYRYATDTMEVSPAITEVEVTTTEEEPIVTEEKADMEIKPELDQGDVKKDFFAPNEFRNGACFDSYCWSQTPKDFELQIRLPDNIKSSKNISVKIEANSISVTSKLDPKADPIFCGKLSANCRHKEVLWTVSEGKVQINLDKMKVAWWDRLVDGEPEIDGTKIDAEMCLEDLPPDAKAAIEKFQLDQQQQSAAAIPTETDVVNVKRLRQAWDTEGSPFKGQPFDPSMVKFN